MPTNGNFTRRSLLKAGSALAAAPIVGFAAPNVLAQTPAKTSGQGSRLSDPCRRRQGRSRKASSSSTATRTRPAPRRSSKAFGKDFPKIKTSYVRAQTGALYNKISPSAPPAASTSTSSSSPTSPPPLDFQKRRLRDLHSPEATPTSPNTQQSGRRLLLDRRHLRRHRLQRRQGEGGGGAEELEGSARSALAQRDELQDLLLRLAVRAVVRAGSSMATITGRRSRSRARAASTRASSSSTGSPRATTRSARSPNTRPMCCTRRRARRSTFVAPEDGLPATPLSSASSTRRRILRPRSSSSTGRCRTAGRRSIRTIRT